ncbi:MAG: hypothetical protein SNJ78_04755, partial [Spirochaetales bacterium]
MGYLLFGAFFVLMLLGVPIGLSIGLSALIVFISMGIPLQLVPPCGCAAPDRNEPRFSREGAPSQTLLVQRGGCQPRRVGGRETRFPRVRIRRSCGCVAQPRNENNSYVPGRARP